MPNTSKQTSFSGLGIAPRLLDISFARDSMSGASPKAAVVAGGNYPLKLPKQFFVFLHIIACRAGCSGTGNGGGVLTSQNPGGGSSLRLPQVPEPSWKV